MSMQILTISKASLLKSLQIHNEGEIAYAVDEDKYYIYQDNTWQETILENAPSKSELNMTLYDMNKQIAKQLNPYNQNQIDEAKKEIREWKQDSVNFYMLYGKEISYFTLFQRQILAKNDFINAVFECLNDLCEGKIYDIEIKNEDAIEIWIDYEGEPTCMFLFNYDKGVVIYNG